MGVKKFIECSLTKFVQNNMLEKGDHRLPWKYYSLVQYFKAGGYFYDKINSHFIFTPLTYLEFKPRT